jgi:carboxymethylenebutenolidase
MRIELPSGTPAELARSESGAPVQGLVLLPDIMGLRPLFDDHCDRLARQYDLVVCAPEPFPGLEDRPQEWRMGNAGAVPDDRRLADILAAADATGQERVGVLGFCMGGMYTLKAAGTGRFSRAVSFYGMVRVPENWRNDTTIAPLDAVTAPQACPVLELCGTEDTFVPVADLDTLEATGATVVRYDGAVHGFVHDPSRPTHRADDAADAWTRAMAFLNGD